jgi:hypothetical protein
VPIVGRSVPKSKSSGARSGTLVPIMRIVSLLACCMGLCACGTNGPAPAEAATGDETAAGGAAGSPAGSGGTATTDASRDNDPGSGGASIDTGAVDRTTIPDASSCNIDRATWTACGNYELTFFDVYWIRNNIWGSAQPGAGEQCTWAASERCWGANAKHLDLVDGVKGAVKGYPQVVRGWSLDDGVLLPASGLGILVGELTKARIHWKMTTPLPGGYIRFMALWDIYFHTNAMPGGEKAQINLMIFQKIRDDEGWFGTDTAALPVVTLGGLPFRMRVSRYGAATERVVTLFLDPHTIYDFGQDEMTLDLKAVIDALVGMGHLSTTTDYLTSIQAGWEIIQGGEFTTQDFWTAVQDEPDPT